MSRKIAVDEVIYLAFQSSDFWLLVNFLSAHSRFLALDKVPNFSAYFKVTGLRIFV